MGQIARVLPHFSRLSKAWRNRVDVDDDPREERQLKELESLGFRRELLPSKSHTEQIVSKLTEEQLEIAKKFALNYCAVAKRRGMALIPGIKQLNRAAISDALRLYSTRPIYLYWRNPAID